MLATLQIESLVIFYIASMLHFKTQSVMYIFTSATSS